MSMNKISTTTFLVWRPTEQTDLVGSLGDELPLVAVEHDVEEALRVERRPADEERDDDGRCKFNCQ